MPSLIQNKCRKILVKRVSQAKKARERRKAPLVEIGLIKCKLEIKVLEHKSPFTNLMQVLIKDKSNQRNRLVKCKTNLTPFKKRNRNY